MVYDTVRIKIKCINNALHYDHIQSDGNTFLKPRNWNSQPKSPFPCMLLLQHQSPIWTEEDLHKLFVGIAQNSGHMMFIRTLDLLEISLFG